MQSLRFCPSRFVRPKFSRGARPLIDVWYVIVIVALIAAGRTDAGSSDPYQIVNLMPRFWKAVETSLNQTPDQQVKSFRDIMGVSATDLYSETDLGFGSSEQLDEAILKTLSNAREYSTEIHHASDALVQTLPACIEKFKQTFPDFSATFPIFILVSLGQLDGAGRVVDGRPCLLLGVDNIASEFSPAILPIFLLTSFSIVIITRLPGSVTITAVVS